MRKWLIDLRTKRGLSQAALAEKIGISQPALCDMERGVINPKPETAMRIADVLGFKWTKFFEAD